MFSSDGILFFARHGAVFAVLGATCFVFGRRLLRGLDFANAGEEIALSLGLGLGTAATVLFGIGLAGRLTGPAILAGILLIHAACLGTWRDAARRARSRSRALQGRDLWPWVPVALACALVAALSCYPPTGFDATLYHLPYARAFALTHRIAILPRLRFPVFPQLSESAFSAVLLLSDDTNVAGVEVLALLAGLAALGGWARKEGGPAAGAWAPAAWAGCPAVAIFAGSDYVDVGFALFALLSFLAWERWREGGNRTWAGLSAVFAGFAAGTKYHGLFVVALLGAMTIWECARGRKGPAPAVLFAAIAGIVSAPAYVRNYLVTGNPVFPFFSRVFGSSPYSLALDAVTPGGTAGSDAKITFLRAAREWLGAPLRVARSLTGMPGISGQAPLSPFLLLLVAAAALAALRTPTVRRALLFAAAYAVACGGAETRFLIPSAALFAYAGAVALGRFAGDRGVRSVAMRTAVAAALVLPGAAWAGHRLARLGPIPVRPGERDAYLLRAFPPYAAIEYLNRSLGSSYTIYAVGAENLAYFADGNYLGDWFGPYSYSRIYGAPAHDGATLDRDLRAIGARYLLLNLARLPAPPPNDASFRRLFRERLRGPGFLLYERTP